MTATVQGSERVVTPAVRPTIGQRLTAGVLIGFVGLLRRLPDLVVYRVAWQVGRALPWVMRGRRRLTRENLARVVRWLVARGIATEPARAAARDRRALDRLVRDAFGHWVVSYAEAAIAPRYDAAELRRRVLLETPELVDEALVPPSPGDPGRLYVSLHLGSLDLAGVYAARMGSIPVVAPMETVANPALAAYFQRTRTELGVRPIPASGAAPVLRAALTEGKAVGLVADRVVTGQGARVELFGAPMRLPVGPSLLAVESDAPLYVLAMRRNGLGSWVGRMELVRPSDEGTKRERIEAVLEDQARTFERLVADAPEQWWTLLFPIWEETPA
jgi:KDO2-lipid IV(A) lauroyltransferase